MFNVFAIAKQLRYCLTVDILHLIFESFGALGVFTGHLTWSSRQLTAINTLSAAWFLLAHLLG